MQKASEGTHSVVSFTSQEKLAWRTLKVCLHVNTEYQKEMSRIAEHLW
jgi:hypothetical protein